MAQIIMGAVFILAGLLGGCAAPQRGNQGYTTTHSQNLEPEWIRNGQPIEFENELWYPKDDVENLLDSEVHLVGKYRDVPFYVDKIDIRPFDRIYTKFSNRKYRVFKRDKE